MAISLTTTAPGRSIGATSGATSAASRASSVIGKLISASAALRFSRSQWRGSVSRGSPSTRSAMDGTVPSAIGPLSKRMTSRLRAISQRWSNAAPSPRPSRIAGPSSDATSPPARSIDARCAIKRRMSMSSPLTGFPLLDRGYPRPADIRLSRAPRRRLLWHQAITASVGDQDLGVRRIAFDLLAQTIDVGFERVGGDARVVAPDLVQQHVAADGAGAGAIEVFEDRGFFLGQSHLLAFGLVDEKLGARPEGVRADGENRVVALLVLPELRPEPRQQHVQPEWFGDVVVGAGVESEHGIGLAVGGGQHQNRRTHAFAPHQPAQLAAVHVRQPDVEDHGVVILPLGKVKRLGRSRGFDRHEFFMQLQLLGERMAQGRIVVDDHDPAAGRHKAGSVANIPPDYRREAGRLSPVSGGGVAVAQDRRWRRRAGTVRDASTDALIPRESAGG